VKRLVVIVSESVRRGGKPLWREVLDALRRHQLAGATATRGLLGFGHTGKLHEGLSPDVPPDLPVTIEAIDEDAAIDRALPDVDALAEGGLVAVHEVQLLKAKKHAHREVAVQHQKLTGKAKMLRIHIGANDTWEGEPLHDALVKRFHQLDLAGATVYRGIEGYGASGRIHKRAVWRSKDEPITVVIVDAAEKIEKALPYLDEMIGNGMVAISDVDVILYKG
jgi:PII-like signaling protein